MSAPDAWPLTLADALDIPLTDETRARVEAAAAQALGRTIPVLASRPAGVDGFAPDEGSQ